MENKNLLELTEKIKDELKKTKEDFERAGLNSDMYWSGVNICVNKYKRGEIDEETAIHEIATATLREINHSLH